MISVHPFRLMFFVISMVYAKVHSGAPFAWNGVSGGSALSALQVNRAIYPIRLKRQIVNSRILRFF